MGVFVFNRGRRRFRKVLDEHRQRLWRMAFAWTWDPGMAEDLAQAVLRRAMKNAPQLGGRDRLVIPLLRMLSDSWMDHLRQQNPAVPAGDIGPLEGPSLEHEHGQRDTLSRVQVEIARLPVGERLAVTLADIEGLSYAEIAEVLGTPVDTVPLQLSAARASLCVALGPEIVRQRQSNGCCLGLETSGQKCWWQAAAD